MNMNNSFPTVGDVAATLEQWAKPEFAESYDNVGLHIGDAARPVHSGLVALDLTPAVVEQAVLSGTSIVITHHPLLFHPLRRITADDLVGSMALRLAHEGIALYSAHTNLDAAPGGVSFALASRLGVETPRFLAPNAEGTAGMGAVGQLKRPVTLASFLQTISVQLATPVLRYVGANHQHVHTVAVCGGAGASLMAEAKKQGADVFVTADISYHRFFEALHPDGSYAMAVVDAGHYETERHAVTLLCNVLQQHFPQVRWAQVQDATSLVRTFVSRHEH